MEKASGIYMIRNTVNGKCYIGQSENMHRRINSHKNALLKNKHRNIYLQRAFDKYGVDAFDFSVVEYCNIDDLSNREVFWIDKYNSFIDGYNLTSGGEGTRGYVMSDERKQQASERMRGLFSGERNPMFGKSWKDYATQDTIEKHNFKIKKQMAESPTNAKPVVCLNTGEQFKTIKDASEKLGAKYSSVMLCCSGKLKNCSSYIRGNKIVCVYESDYLAMSADERKERLSCGQADTKGKNNPNSKSIVNLTTGEHFNTVLDAANTYSITPSGISLCLTGTHLSSGKSDDGVPYVWVYSSEFWAMSQDEINNKIMKAKMANKGENKPNARSVICVTTGEIFSNATEAANTFHIDTSSLIKCCKGKTKSCGKLNGEKLIWQYAS